MPTRELEVDRPRLERLLGGPSLSRLRRRLVDRLASTGALAGKLVLSAPTEDERRAIDALLGRAPRRGSTVSFDLGPTEEALRRAGIAPSLRAAIEALEGEVPFRGDALRAREARLEAAMAVVEGTGDSVLVSVFRDARADGLLARLLGAELDDLDALASRLAELAAALAAHSGSISKAELAAKVTGDAHALDDGDAYPALRALALRYVGALRARGAPKAAEAVRAAWAEAGVEVDALASNALVLNLEPDQDDGPLGAALLAHHREGEPLRITGRSLRRHPPRFEGLAGRDVFVCENPSVVLAAARELGPCAAPLVCTEGQPSLAVADLLDLLTTRRRRPSLPRRLRLARPPHRRRHTRPTRRPSVADARPRVSRRARRTSPRVMPRRARSRVGSGAPAGHASAGGRGALRVPRGDAPRRS